MNKFANKPGTGPLFESWLDVPTPDPCPPEPVNHHGTVLDTPKSDAAWEDNLELLEEQLEHGGTVLADFSEAETQAVAAEVSTWSTSKAPGEPGGHRDESSLRAKFSRWSPTKQESFFQALAAFQTHSFALEKAPLDENAVRDLTRELVERSVNSR